jgi:F0F1-type ATP synthase assembly protein I
MKQDRTRNRAMGTSLARAMPEPSPKRGSDLMQFADLGLRLALAVAVFTYAGYRLDAWLSTSPWFLIALCFAGVAGGMVSVVRGVNRWQAADKADKAQDEAGRDTPDDAA